MDSVVGQGRSHVRDGFLLTRLITSHIHLIQCKVALSKCSRLTAINAIAGLPERIIIILYTYTVGCR